MDRIDPTGMLEFTIGGLNFNFSVRSVINSMSSITMAALHVGLLGGLRLLTQLTSTSSSAWDQVHRLSTGVQTAIIGPSVRLWGVTAQGINQGIKHFYQYRFDPALVKPDKIYSHFTRVCELLNKPISYFAPTRGGFENWTNTAMEIVTNPQSFSKGLNHGRTAYFWIVNETEGIIVFVQNGQLQSMYATTWKYYLTGIH